MGKNRKPKFHCKNAAQKYAIRKSYAERGGQKNKPSRKWNRAHEFKRKKSTPNKVGHPVFVYGKSGRDSKYLVFTHKPKDGDEENYEKLDHNIDPDETDEDSYVKKEYEIGRSDGLREPDKEYRIHNDDKEKIKKYKK